MRIGSNIPFYQLNNEAFAPIFANDRTIRICMQAQVTAQEPSADDEAVFSLFMSRLDNVPLPTISQKRLRAPADEEFSRYAGVLKALLETLAASLRSRTCGGVLTC